MSLYRKQCFSVRLGINPDDGWWFETTVTQTVGLFLSWRRASEVLVPPAIQITLKALVIKCPGPEP